MLSGMLQDASRFLRQAPTAEFRGWGCYTLQHGGENSAAGCYLGYESMMRHAATDPLLWTGGLCLTCPGMTSPFWRNSNLWRPSP